MTAPCVEACSPWITADELASCKGDATNDQIDAAIAAATDILFTRGGRQFPGSCLDTVTVRPCYGWDNGTSVLNSWIGWAAGSRTFRIDYSNGFCGSAKLGLGAYPVTQVNSVTVDGVVMNPALYGVVDYRWLVRKPLQVGGPDLPWTYNEMIIEFVYGIGPPPSGVQAARALACQYIKALASPGDCLLSPRVNSVNRQGISINLTEPGDIEHLPEVKMFLDSYNKYRVTEPASVYSPDIGNDVSRRYTS